MKIGILQTGRVNPNIADRHSTYPEMFVRLLNAHLPEATFETVDVVGGEGLPPIDSADAWLVTGSKFGVYDPEPWIPPLKTFLRDAYAADVPLIGVCFGHQIMAEALGGRTEKSDRGWGAGLHDYDVAPGAELLEGDDGRAALSLHAMHQDQVVAPPPDARVLARSDFCDFAALAYGPSDRTKAVSVQGHPEFDAAFERDLVEQLRGDRIPEPVAAAALASLDGERRHEGDRVARWFARFLSAAVRPPAVAEASRLAVATVYDAPRAEGAAPDYVLEPAAHAAGLPAAGGPLARALGRPAILSIMDRYRTADADAIAAQRRYRRIGTFGAAAVLAPQIAAAFVLVFQAAALENLAVDATRLALIAQALALGCALAAAYALRRGKPFETWMRRRAVAEIARIELFDAVARADEPNGPNEAPHLALALEYVNRYQLDVQRAYFEQKSRSHGAAAGRSQTARRLNVVLFAALSIPVLIGAAAAVLGASSPLAGAPEQLFLAFGAAGAGFVAYFGALSLLSLDQRNAARYGVVAETLEAIDSEHREAARLAAARGDRRGVEAYVAAIHRTISAEHQDWISASERRPRLDLQLLGDAQG